MENKKKLNFKERQDIYRYRRLGYGKSRIADVLKRDKSTIKRELDRNEDLISDQGLTSYQIAEQAHERYLAKKRSAGSRMRLKSKKIQEYVETKLKEKWSPEIIAGRLKKEHPECKISYEAIYQWINEERADLKEYLLIGGKSKRRRRIGKNNNRKPKHKFKALKKGIELRPKEADERKEIGHFEQDTVVSKQSTNAIQNITDRKSRKVFLDLVPCLKSDVYSTSLINRFQTDVPQKARKSLTSDNGVENSMFDKVEKTLGLPSFFARPYCSSDKGTVENRNRVIRRTFPKGTDFSKVDIASLKALEDKINNTPLKILGYRTPNEEWFEDLYSLTKANTSSTTLQIQQNLSPCVPLQSLSG